MNKGIAKANGDWIWFMNMGDAFAAPGIVEKVFLKVNHKKNRIIFGDTMVENGAIKYIKRFYPSIEKNFKHGILHLNHQSVLVHKDVFKKVGYFNATQYPIRADMNHLTKAYFVFHANAFLHVEMVLAVYQEDGVSSSLSNLMKMYEEDMTMQREFDTPYNVPSLWVKKWYSYLKAKGLQSFKNNWRLYRLYRRIKYYFITHIEEQA
jgi:hypothetical protein